LGEEASSFPLWVVASLQEWIEETGEINPDTFNKIKDRYPAAYRGDLYFKIFFPGLWMGL